jgi:hypothetical protein
VGRRTASEPTLWAVRGATDGVGRASFTAVSPSGDVDDYGVVTGTDQVVVAVPVQSTPHSPFDPTLMTAVAVAVAAAAVGLSVGGRRVSTRRRLLVGGGAAYGTTVLCLWAGVRLVFWRFAFDPVGDAPVVVPVLTVFGVVIAGQFVLSTYLFVAHGTWTPLVWLFGVTWALVEFVLMVGGESGGLFALLVWTVALLPACLGVLVVTTGGELLLRRADLSNPLWP